MPTKSRSRTTTNSTELLRKPRKTGSVSSAPPKSTIALNVSQRASSPFALLPLATPGEILKEEFLVPLGLSANALAIDLHVPANRIQAILKGLRGITADTALRLAQYFGNSPEFWLNLQQNYELDMAKREKLSEIEAQVLRRPHTQAKSSLKENRRKSGD